MHSTAQKPRLATRRRLKHSRKTASVKFPVFVIVLLIFITGLGGFLFKKFSPNSAQIFPLEYYALDPDKISIIMGDNFVELVNHPYQTENDLYLPADFLNAEIDPYVFWDKEKQKLIITTETEVIRMKMDELSYDVNDEPVKINLPVIMKDDMGFMPSVMVTDLYNIDMVYIESNKILTIDKKDILRVMGKVKKDTKVRYEATKKAPYYRVINSSEEFMIFEETENFTKIRTNDGILGYIETKQISSRRNIEPVFEKEIILDPPQIDEKEDIVLLWDQVFNVTAAANKDRRPTAKQVNVLAPTWFSFEEDTTTGEIVSLANLDYVKWAHSEGYQVWGLLTDNFNSEVSHLVLTDTDVRQRVIDQILTLCALYELDGINIDFEAVLEKDGPYYTQFLRELKPLLKNQDTILSVDLFVPTYTQHFNRSEIAKTVDYVCVMTYDEHYSGGPNSGPVASLGFVEDGLYNTLKGIPEEKLLMGVPFYTRVWREVEKDGVISFTAKSHNMTTATRQFVENNASFVWLEDTGYTYAEYQTVEDGQTVTYKAWIEDEKSIAKKLELAKKYNIKGLALWKSGLETTNIWDVVDEYIKN